MRDQVGDGVVGLLQRSGSADAAIASHRRTWIGAMAWYRARVAG